MKSHGETLLVIQPTQHKGSMRNEYPPTSAHADMSSPSGNKQKQTHHFPSETGLFVLPQTTVNMRGMRGSTTYVDAGGDNGVVEALLHEDEAGAGEATREERQDYPLHVVHRQLHPGFSSSPHPCSPSSLLQTSQLHQDSDGTGS
jgi:hypothetical protein